MSKLKNHPYADLFPLMNELEIEALSVDIAEHGLRHPIMRYKGMILDGRNRLRACETAKVEPAFTDFEGDDEAAHALVISLNVQRRDMTAGQRSIVAARCMEQMPERRGGNHKQKAGSKPFARRDEEVASTFKVGKESVKQAKALLTEASDLVADVESRTKTLAAAHQELQERRKLASQRAKDREKASEYAEAIESGAMTFEDALQEEHAAEREAKDIEAASDGKPYLTGRTVVDVPKGTIVILKRDERDPDKYVVWELGERRINQKSAALF